MEGSETLEKITQIFVSFFENRCCVTLVVSIPSFPHAFSGNPGEFRTGPPIKAFGGDELGLRAQISSSVGERKLMKHFVVKKPTELEHLDFRLECFAR